MHYQTGNYEVWNIFSKYHSKNRECCLHVIRECIVCWLPSTRWCAHTPSSLRRRRGPVRIHGSFVGEPWRSRRSLLASSQTMEKNGVKSTHTHTHTCTRTHRSSIKSHFIVTNMNWLVEAKSWWCPNIHVPHCHTSKAFLDTSIVYIICQICNTYQIVLFRQEAQRHVRVKWHPPALQIVLLPRCKQELVAGMGHWK